VFIQTNRTELAKPKEATGQIAVRAWAAEIFLFNSLFVFARGQIITGMEARSVKK
jgi:hypothetical protein